LKFQYHLLAISAIVFWGISLVATKTILLHDFTPNFITFVRFGLASLILEISYFSDKQKIQKGHLRYFILMALGGISLFYYFETVGLKYTSVANTALITATIPLFTLLAAMLFFQKKLSWQNYFGIILGLSGTVLLFYKDIMRSSLHIRGDILVFLSVIMWIVYSFSYKKIMHKYNPSFITRKIFQIGLICLLPLLAIEGKQNLVATWNGEVIVSFLFLALICSYLAYYFWNIAIKNIGIKVTSNFILFLPIVSIIAGIIAFSEPFSFLLIWASLMIITGAYLSSKSAKENSF
jgi:drug/metabolite transporter (DMT)-like permease